jgi:hypothetical protein
VLTPPLLVGGALVLFGVAVIQTSAADEARTPQ